MEYIGVMNLIIPCVEEMNFPVMMSDSGRHFLLSDTVKKSLASHFFMTRQQRRGACGFACATLFVIDFLFCNAA
ncbi:hypothetical protein SMC92_003108 [Cronobacter dublinensis]|nr:hypothetical protein [Cronobacter dublinensis]